MKREIKITVKKDHNHYALIEQVNNKENEINRGFFLDKDQYEQLRQHFVSGSLLNDWQKWEDCILSFLRTYPKVREDFNKHVDEWNTHSPLPPSAYERGEQ
jgi:hypothetical protein